MSNVSLSTCDDQNGARTANVKNLTPRAGSDRRCKAIKAQITNRMNEDGDEEEIKRRRRGIKKKVSGEERCTPN